MLMFHVLFKTVVRIKCGAQGVVEVVGEFIMLLLVMV
jgi:hypothetical protein